MNTKRWVRGSSLVLVGVVMAGVVNAAEPQTAAPQTTLAVQGVQVAIDPATGHLVAPTAAQRAALSRAMLRQAAAAPQNTRGPSVPPRDEAEARKTFHTFQLKNGHRAVGMALPENLMSSLVVERQADGSLSVHHAGDAPMAVAAQEVTK